MRFLCSREEMQAIDAYSIHEIGIPGVVLMEKAAMAAKEEICKRYPEGASVLIVTERGNNGGDGLALGRLLMGEGFQVTFYEIGHVPKASESYEIQRNILVRLEAVFVEEMPEKDFDLWVDAVFGVGLKREVAGIHKSILDTINEKKGFKMALDVPSGVDASTGQILGTAFRADLTVTFGQNKVGLVLYPGAGMAGTVMVKDIGFPAQAVSKVSPAACTFGREDLSLLPQRRSWSHKGAYGRVLLIAGAKNMAGAAYLSGLAAYKSGCGLVRIFTCEENRVILQQQLPEAIMTTYSTLEEAAERLPEALSWATAAGIGPGLSTSFLAMELVRTVLQYGKIPLVLDADGLNCLAMMKKENPKDYERLYENYEHGIIVTPHLKEMSRLNGQTIKELQMNLPGAAEEFADKKHVCVLKDARTVVSDGSFPSYINMSGNHGMSVGGSGDVLTGMICGLLAGGLDLLTAARLGVFCHGLAGDEAAKEKGYYGLLARDLPEYLGRVIR